MIVGLYIVLLGFIPSTQNQESQQEKEIEKAIKELSADDPQIREQAMRRLINLGAEKQVEPLLKSEDEEVKLRASTILKILRFVKENKFEELFKKDQKFVEELVSVEKIDWVSHIGKKLMQDPNALSKEQRSRFAAQILKENSVVEEMERNATDEWAWLCLEALEQGDGTLLRNAVLGLRRSVARMDKKQAEEVLKRILPRLEEASKGLNMTFIMFFATLVNKANGDILDEVAKVLLTKLGSKEGYLGSFSESLLSKLASKLEEKTLENMTKTLLTNLKEKNSGALYSSANIIASLASKLSSKDLDEAISALTDRIDDIDVQVRSHCISALGKLVQKDDKERAFKISKKFLEKLEEKENGVVSSAIGSLTLIFETLDAAQIEELTKALIKNLEKSDTIRRSSITVLGKAVKYLKGDLLKQVLTLVVKSLDDSVFNVRMAALSGIGSSINHLDGELLMETVKVLLKRVKESFMCVDVCRVLKNIIPSLDRDLLDNCIEQLEAIIEGEKNENVLKEIDHLLTKFKERRQELK